ncbi:uncharacterized protein LOC134195434 [Corticium candelabrum]|uniref:uncharacterized protein LOC134195434 n=1 Tax=Corticium candelabrum TaxID=121492 RepID=UPI002E25A88F|nr:uncharacterized protein LOC134195434 [Corticium candelabrum]
MSVYKENAPGCLSLTHSPSLPELGSNTVLHNDCQTPEGKKRRRFGRLRLRKRKPAEPSGDQADTLSLCSISSLASISSVSSIRSVKSKTPLSRVTAHFAHLVASSPPIRALKRTFDGENSNPSKKAFKRYHSPEVKYKPREKKCWVETIENSENFSTSDIKRQEAIHELVTTEEVMRDDLTSVVECMFHPLKKITLLTAEEHSALFGCIDELLPLHKDVDLDMADIEPYRFEPERRVVDDSWA